MNYLIIDPKTGIVIFKGSTELLKTWNPIMTTLTEELMINMVKQMGLSIYKEI